MARSLKKGPFINQKLYKKIININKGLKKKEPFNTWARSSTIIPDMIGHTINVHNGKIFIPVYITENLIGHKLGEFSPTRIFKSHSGSKKGKLGR